MTANLSPSQSQTIPLIKPNRITVIDALRGFALIGIIINHSAGQFLAGMAPTSYNILFTPFDHWVDIAVNYLTSGKFFTIFSFLFGLSFAIQMNNAAQAGRPFVGRTVWRLVILFGIGFTHGLFFSGDILCVYAFLGLFLVLLRKAGNRVLIIVGLLLVFNAPLLLGRISAQLSPPVQTSQPQQPDFMKEAEAEFRTKQTGTLAEVIAMNAKGGLLGTLGFQLFTGRLFITLGLFLLGLWAGRKRLFVDTPNHRHFFRQLLLWSGLTMAVSSGVWIALTGGDPFAQLPGWTGVLAPSLFDIHQATLSAFYVAGLTLLFWQTRAWLLHQLVAVGRMGLTTYLSGTAFGVLLFLGYGLGQLGQLSVSASVGLGLAFFALQIPLSNWWLTRYQFGPVEWLWRSLTYLKPQPWRKSRSNTAALNPQPLPPVA